MKRLFGGIALSAVILLLSGCYVDPTYSHVRRTSYQGDAYYGQGLRGYGDGYYAAPLYSPYYGGTYGYGCCHAPGVGVGISTVWYSRPRHYRGERPRYRSYGNYRGERPGYRRYGNERGYQSGLRSRPRQPNTGRSRVERRDGERRAHRVRSREH